jgi:DNA-binding response OmpR family regulator
MMGWIDTDKVDKIIFNLLSNAAKYTKENGWVELTISTNRNFDHIIIKVSDNGGGIPKDRMRNLFTRFQDGEYRNYHTFGTGLGLALTRDMVYLHRGSIHCESSAATGTTFIVDLPIGKEAFSASQIDEESSMTNVNHRALADMKATKALSVYRNGPAMPPADENASHLLIVEDNEELLMLMSHLMQAKYHIHTATNGEEALLALRSTPVDLVVSDVMMPVMNGYELTKSIKHDETLSHIPVILLTAKTLESDKEEALTIGADGYLAKPFKLGELQLRIDNLIANRQRIMHGKEPAEPTDDDVTEKPLTAEQEFLQRATRCVYDHLDDADYTREAFAADMGASTSTLYNKLREATGSNIVAFIRDIRLKEACRMAKENPDLRVSDIAYRVGYKDPKYFATTFKKVMGEQPKEYFDKLRGEQ